MKFLFVGEERSELAKKMNVRWQDGRLAAKQLFDALNFCGINPQHQMYINLFESTFQQGINEPIEDYINRCKRYKIIVVGMGRRVQRELNKMNIDHLSIVHPAAKGKIRKKQVYCEHVKSVLLNA